MQTIPLQKIPQQTLSITLDDAQYDITIQTTAAATFMSASRNGVALVAGAICAANTAIIRYPLRRGGGGDFVFITPSDELPNYEQFGDSHYLVYATAAEVAGI